MRDYVVGQLRIDAGHTLEELTATWLAEVADFERRSAPYLIYR